MMREGAINKCFMHVWPMLMKLRQMCDHVLLTQGRSKAAPTDATIESVLNQIEIRLGQRKLMETELEVEEESTVYHKKRGKTVRNDSVVFDRPKFREWVQDFYFTDPEDQLEDHPEKSNKMDEEKPFGSSLINMVSKPSMPENQLSTSRFCPVCLAQTFEMEDPIITSCGHIGCLSCYLRCISNQSTCPLCSFIIHKEDLIRLPIE